MISQQTNQSRTIAGVLAIGLSALLFLGCSGESSTATPMPAGHSPGMVMTPASTP